MGPSWWLSIIELCYNFYVDLENIAFQELFVNQYYKSTDFCPWVQKNSLINDLWWFNIHKCLCAPMLFTCKLDLCCLVSGVAFKLMLLCCLVSPVMSYRNRLTHHWWVYNCPKYSFKLTLLIKLLFLDYVFSWFWEYNYHIRWFMQCNVENHFLLVGKLTNSRK